MKVTVDIPDDAFCDDCPFYIQYEETADICNYLAIYSTDDDSELLEYVKLRGQRHIKRVKSESCPNKAGVEARKNLKNIQTDELLEFDEEEDE